MLIPFYLNATKNNNGLGLEEIWMMTDEELENDHEIVQWVFPTIEESNFNPEAPLLKNVDIQLWNANPQLIDNLRTSFNRYLKLFGLKYEEGKIADTDMKDVWKYPNHNWMRVTRILNSLKTLGLTEESEAFYDFLKVRFKDATGLAKQSFSCWKGVMEDEV